MKLCECGCEQPAPLAKFSRPKDGIAVGDPMRFIAGHQLRVHGRRRGPLEDRFWRSVNKGGGGAERCWNWTASVNTYGYGQIRDEKGTYQSAHRISWRLHNGGIPDGLQVLHRCDNTRCVRPDHLFLGTQLDNIHDRDQKGRHRNGATGPLA